MVQKNPAISVIVAVYKAEKYLSRFFDTLLSQTFTDFEVLAIDDGSPDRSGEMCEEYARKDARVKVFHKENGGVASARQYGIERASGEYTIHADPDDWVEPDMLKLLYEKAVADDADMVICDYYEESAEGTALRRQEPSSFDAREVLRDLFTRKLHGGLWTKLIRRSAYETQNIRFFKGLNFAEDLFFCTQLLKCGIKVSYCGIALYHYDTKINANSLNLNLVLEQGDRYIAATKTFLQEPEYREEYINSIGSALFLIFETDALTSREFRRRYGMYRKLIWKMKARSFQVRMLLYFSCLGFYRPVYWLLSLKRKIAGNHYFGR